MIAGRYRLEREIGRGGAGVVHLAHDELLGRQVAVKRIGLLPGTTSEDVSRAQREARLAAGINHPHVVSIFDLVKDEDCYWLVMEHVEGRTLAELVAAEGPLPDRRAAGILAQAADALVQAGRAGVVHRDVKPSNIIVGSDDRAKLGDFGIARAASDTALTQTGMVTGSPAYLAPEVASGEPATAASDIWSLGATLFHAVAGRPPYDMGQNLVGGLYRIVHDDPPRLTDDHATAGILARMLVKDPDERWSAEQVRDDLRRIARGDASTAVARDRRAEDGGQTTVAMAAVPQASATQRAAGATTRSTAASTGPSSAVVDDAPVSTPPPSPPDAGRPARSRGLPLGRTAAVLALVLLAGIGAWLLWPRDGEPSDAARDTETSASAEPSASEEPTAEPTSAEPSETEEPAEEPTTSDAPAGTPAAARAFVRDYFAQVTSDPGTTFTMLTPEFQSQSGGYEGYSGFWSTIESATPRAIRVDPDSLTASYTIDFVTASGRETTEQGQLQLVQQGDGFLIAGEG